MLEEREKGAIMAEYIVGSDGKGQEWVTCENIVRCKDCKYAGTNDCVLDEHVPFKPNGFCSWGDAR